MIELYCSVKRRCLEISHHLDAEIPLQYSLYLGGNLSTVLSRLRLSIYF